MNFGYLDSYIDSINRDKHIPAVGITVYKHGRPCIHMRQDTQILMRKSRSPRTLL